MNGSENSLRLAFVIALAFSGVVSRAGQKLSVAVAFEEVFAEAKELGLLLGSDSARTTTYCRQYASYNGNYI